MNHSPVHLDGKDNEPLDREMRGATIMIAVRVDHPGSVASHIFIGDYKVAVPNAALRQAYKIHDDVCDTEGG